jgi:formylglycine-generating enzyme required for sulfatase activity
MARIEKTVFISYRRKDISWALAVYQHLISQKYDVFFDFKSLSGGDFEQVIISNIKARAHFILILTPTALDRCDQPGDWLRREIETAIDEKRNIIPLFFEGFNFGVPSAIEKLTGKLVAINHYNGLDVPSGYFIEAMERLCSRYLNLPLDSVLHPISTEVRRKVDEEKIAANNALLQKKEDIQELIKPSHEKLVIPKQFVNRRAKESSTSFRRSVGREVVWRPYILGAGILLLILLGISGVRSLINNVNVYESPLPPHRDEAGIESTPTLTKLIPTDASVIPSYTLIPTVTHQLQATKTVEPIIPTPAAIFPVSPASAFLPQTSVSTLVTDDSVISPKDKMTLLYVPAGSFVMGSNKNEVNDGDESTHNVTLDAYFIDQTEVTNAMYKLCVQAGVCKPPDNSRYSDPTYADHPVTSVTWENAYAYCSWTGRRLPTEAEWEKAARGKSGFIYPWGNLPDDSLLNYNSLEKDTTPVNAYPGGASPYGVLDMAGNVWEWVNDWYDDDYYNDSPKFNPPGPDSGSYRVIRGGGWKDTKRDVRSANRGPQVPTNTDSTIGFRCAMDVSE